MPDKRRKQALMLTGLAMLILLPVCAQAFKAPDTGPALYSGTENVYLVSDNTSQAQQAKQAKNFIQSMGDEVILYISDPSLSRRQQKQHLEMVLIRNFDMDTICRFTLGRYWRTLDTAQKREYRSLYEDMIVEIYAEKFSNYKGEKFTVNSVLPSGTTNFIVKSHIIPPSGKNIPVSWHVRLKNGTYRIIDVAIEGVSMIITQKSDFSSVIQREGGEAAVILDYLRNRINNKT